MNIKYPNITVKLVGTDGNVFSIIGAVCRDMRRAKVPSDEITAFQTEVMASESYDGALQCVMRHVNVR